MDATKDPLFERIHQLVAGLVDESLSSEELQELKVLLVESPEARRMYVEYIQESACLRWLCVEEFEEAISPTSTPAATPREQSAGRRRYALVVGGILASVVFIAFGLRSFSVRPEGGEARNETAGNVAKAQPVNDKGAGDAGGETGSEAPVAAPAIADARSVVATVTGLNSIRWDSQTVGPQLLSRCSVGDQYKLQSGSAELTFDVGVQMTVFGPADFEITSANSIRCRRGRVTTLVDKRGRGFWIETPRAKVVDLGTQFGLSISDEGDTEVVVFQGMVDVSYSSQQAAGDAPSRRMRQGEALLLKNSGELERVVSVQRNNFMGTTAVPGHRPSEPVIGDVRDNIRSADSAKSYQIVHNGLDDDALAFVDRNHQWNGLTSDGLPGFLAGADYIMPFNDDKFVRGLELQVRVIRPATMYIFLDNNMDVPNWLREQFTDSGVDVGLDCSKTEWHRDHSSGTGAGKSIDFVFSVWKREIKQPSTVTLGGLAPPKDRRQGFNMYGIAAVASDNAAE